MNVPIADMTEHYDSTSKVFLLNRNVLLKSVTAQKCDPESHRKIIIHPSIISLLSIPLQSCSQIPSCKLAVLRIRLGISEKTT